MKRQAGILLPITSLPSAHGVGTLGREAYAFVDFLKCAGQSCWQILPLGPTGYGDSPYQSASAFAGNPYLIDLDLLADDGLLTREEIDACSFGDDPALVDYGKLYENRLPLLWKAFSRFDRENMRQCAAEMDAQSDYALFAALKLHFGGLPWTQWPDEGARLRRPDVLEWYRGEQADRIAFFHFLQYTFDRQWAALKAYARVSGVSFIGDIPIYVPLDSCEVWERPNLFLLDAAGKPSVVAGVPPDCFTALGQLWGNPIYDWAAHEAEGFAWWKRRIAAAAARYDVVRIDHFRGIESFWAVPADAPDARPGQWLPGPGEKLIRAIQEAAPDARIIAEDLGYLTPEVKRLLSASGYPGMRVMVFGFNPKEDSRELPHNYPAHCVAYTSTHDSSTAMGFFMAGTEAEAAYAVDYLGLNAEEGLPFGFIRGLYASAAELAIVPIQDFLGLDDGFRTNRPGLLGQWRYRVDSAALTAALADRIAYYAHMYGRQPR